MDSPSDTRARVLAGDRRALARAISSVEEGGEGASALLTEFHGAAAATRVIGITGAPGAGKSTLTNVIVRQLRHRGERVAVVAVDPSSPFTGGAILGDRIRMQDHTDDDGVYIRSMSSRGRLGGLAAAVPEVVTILAGAEFDVVIVETVGVGQAEVDIVEQADTTVVVLTPGWGDGVQANKAGLLEIGDVFVVNKADRDGSDATARDIESMLDLGEQFSGAPDWRAPVVCTTATTGDGVDDLLAAIDAHAAHLADGAGDARLQVRRLRAFDRVVERHIVQRLTGDSVYESARQEVADGTVDPWTAAQRVLGTI